MKKQSKSAFTLIELLVVISIIAILAAIAMPVYGKVMRRAQVTTTSNSLRQMAVAVSVYLADNDDQMITGDATWVASTNGSDGFLGKYLGGNPKALQCPFDKRSGEGGNSPVSLSFNKEVLAPSTAPSDRSKWDGNWSRMKRPSATILAVPNYALGDGDPDKKESWGSNSVNVCSSVNTVPAGGGNIGGSKSMGLSGKLIPIVRCDTSITQYRIGEAGGGTVTDDNFRNEKNWKPLDD